MSDGSLAAVFGDSALYQQCVAKNRANVQAGTAPEYSYPVSYTHLDVYKRQSIYCTIGRKNDKIGWS